MLSAKYFKKVDEFKLGGLVYAKSNSDRIYKIMEYNESPFTLTLRTYGNTNDGHWNPSKQPRITVNHWPSTARHLYQPCWFKDIKAMGEIIELNVGAAKLKWGKYSGR